MSADRTQPRDGERHLQAREALNHLIEGNRRFAAGGAVRLVATLAAERPSEHKPLAVVLGCSDARVPLEIVLDQGIGDLFVIRVAGNIVAPSQLGSMEYAVTALGVRLIVVLGHGDCGAVKAALDFIDDPTPAISDNHRFLMERIAPAIAESETDARQSDVRRRVEKAVRHNVEAAVSELTASSPILAGFIESGELLVVGAEYSVDTGLVDFHTGDAGAST